MLIISRSKAEGGEVHNVEFNLDALRALDIPVVSKKLYLSVNIVHEEFADEFVKSYKIDSKKIIGISKTGGWESKRYKKDDYIELINRINEKYDVNFILIWGNERERVNCEYIKDRVSKDNVYLIPDSPIRYLGAIIKKCDLVIGNDSGPLHIAVAMGVPTLGIYGPTNPNLQGPYGDNNLFVVNEKLDCLYCNLLDCPIGNICMTQLSKDSIMEKINDLVKKNNINLKSLV